jgi:hypothetical protein
MCVSSAENLITWSVCRWLCVSSAENLITRSVCRWLCVSSAENLYHVIGVQVAVRIKCREVAVTLVCVNTVDRTSQSHSHFVTAGQAVSHSWCWAHTMFYYTVCESWGALLTKVWVLLLSQHTVLVASTLHIYMYSAGTCIMWNIYRAFISPGMVRLMLVLTDTLFYRWICKRYWPRFEGLNFGVEVTCYYYYYYYYYYTATFPI